MLKQIKELLIALSEFSLFVLAVGIFLLLKSAYMVYLDLDYKINFILGISLCCLSYFMTFIGLYLINKENKLYKKLSLVEFYSMLYAFTSFPKMINGI